MQIPIEKMWSIASEAGVIASIIVGPACLMDVISELPDVEMFFEDKHKILYDTLLDLFLAKTPIDAITLRNQLEMTGKLDASGGVEYISKVMQSVPSSANALYYAKRVKEKYQYRNMLLAVAKIQSVSLEDNTISEQIAAMQKIVFELDGEKQDRKPLTPKNGRECIRKLREGTTVISTGFKDIDSIIGGFTQGEYNIIAARPSIGKTSLALNMAVAMAKRGDGVLFFTLEMPEEALLNRMISCSAKISLLDAKKKMLTPEQWQDFEDESDRLDKLPITFTSLGTTVEQITSMVRKVQKTQEVKCIFIDYIQLMRTTGKVENRHQQISEISGHLKRLAINENVIVVVLSQLNRMVESRTSHRPIMSDLRESGSLEQDGDIIMFIHRADYYRAMEGERDPCKFDGLANIIVAKSKNGETGDVQLVFARAYCSFETKSNLGEFVYGK